uniref:Death domain-containing protein n=1 Tax=Branchiostoma floridae TaxID=7739 RepID=C3Y775_BRAFL|eukprot:XP_002607693.1 hypothetical protein BRAFLDRAFT_82861 [Branchiostoma floridae]
MPSQVPRGRNYSTKDDLDRAFDIVESEVQTSWKILAMELGQTLDEILVFERQSWKVPDQCRKSLDWWRLMAGPKGATVPNLVRALRNCRLDWVADKIEGKSPIRVPEKETITLEPANLDGVRYLKEAPKPKLAISIPTHDTSPRPVQKFEQQGDEHSTTFIIVKKKSKIRKEKKRSKSEPRKSRVTISTSGETSPFEQHSQVTTHFTPLQRSETIHSSAPMRSYTNTAPQKMFSGQLQTRPSKKSPETSTRRTQSRRSETYSSSAPTRDYSSTAPQNNVIPNQETSRPREEPPRVTKAYTPLQRSETIHSSAPSRSNTSTAPPQLPIAPPRTKQTRHSRFLEHRGRPRERKVDGIKNYKRISTQPRRKPVEEITDWTKVTVHPPEKKNQRRKEIPRSQSSIVRIVPSTPLSTEEGDFLYWERPSHERGPVIPVLLKPQSSYQDDSSVEQKEEISEIHRSPKSIQQNGGAEATTTKQTKARETTPPVPPRRKRRKSNRRASPMYLNNEYDSSDEYTRRPDEYTRRRSYRGIVLDRETDRVDEDPLQVRTSTRMRRARSLPEVSVARDVEEENRQNLNTEAVQESHRYDNLLLVGGTRRMLGQQRRTQPEMYEDQTIDNKLNVNQEQLREERFAESRHSDGDIIQETRDEYSSSPLQLHYADILKEELIIYYPLDEFETDSNYSASLNGETAWATEDTAFVAPSEEPVFHTADILREEMVVYVPEEELVENEEVQRSPNSRYDNGIPHINAGHVFEEYIHNHTRSEESLDRLTGSYVSSVNVGNESEPRASHRGPLETDYVKMSRKNSRESASDETQNAAGTHVGLFTDYVKMSRKNSRESMNDETQDAAGTQVGFFTRVPRKDREGGNAESDDVFEEARFRRLGLQKKAASVNREDSLRKKTVSFSEQPIVIPSDDNQESEVAEYYVDAMLW